MTEEKRKGANEAAFAGAQWIKDHLAADLKGVNIKALHGGASCCPHTGYPQHLEQGRALIFRKVEPIERMAEKIKLGAVGLTPQSCDVCKRWKEFKGIVPRDGSIYFIDKCRRGTDTSIPQELSRSTAISTVSTAPTPTLFQACTSEFNFNPRDWCDLDDAVWQEAADRQLAEDDQNYQEDQAERQIRQESTMAEEKGPEEIETPIQDEGAGTPEGVKAWLDNNQQAESEDSSEKAVVRARSSRGGEIQVNAAPRRETRGSGNGSNGASGKRHYHRHGTSAVGAEGGDSGRTGRYTGSRKSVDG